MVEKLEKLETKVEIQGRDMDVMSKSIEHLATAVGETNVELKEVVKAITEQNVLTERMNNLEHNLEESFDRVHGRAKRAEEAIKDAVSDQKTYVSGTVIRWAIVLGVGIMLSIIGTMRVSNVSNTEEIAEIRKELAQSCEKTTAKIHRLDNQIVEITHNQRGINNNNENTFIRLEASVRYLLEKE